MNATNQPSSNTQNRLSPDYDEDLSDYLEYYNNKRRHYGRWNQGKPPSDIIDPKTKLRP